VSELGQIDWSIIADQMEGRTPRQCKERWTHYLSPSITRESWLPNEDDLLLELVNEHGRKWKTFERSFPGRTDINIKNRYNVLTRRKAKEVKIAMKLPLKMRRKLVEPEVNLEGTFDWPVLSRSDDFDQFWDSLPSSGFPFY
jgi:hypothetical protein